MAAGRELAVELELAAEVEVLHAVRCGQVVGVNQQSKCGVKGVDRVAAINLGPWAGERARER